jgi:N-acetylmuramic acid 6-phosphate etherase
MLRALLDAERKTPEVVAGALPEIERVVERAAAALREGGRIVYAGAGTSGRLGVLDAAECPPTFGVGADRVVGLIAGGREAVFAAREGAEDDEAAGAADLRAMAPGPADLVIGIAASGVTPWVRGALAAARAAGAATAFVTASEPRGIEADTVVRIPTGPEILAGSTRLKAGTATKLVLNLVSTGAMVRTGRVFGHRMVDLRAGSAKLRARAERLVRELTGLPSAGARDVLARAEGEVKTAVVMANRGLGPEEARKRLAEAGGFLRAALRGEGQ